MAWSKGPVKTVSPFLPLYHALDLFSSSHGDCSNFRHRISTHHSSMKEKRDKLTFVALQAATKLIILILLAIMRAVTIISVRCNCTYARLYNFFFYRLPYIIFLTIVGTVLFILILHAIKLRPRKVSSYIQGHIISKKEKHNFRSVLSGSHCDALNPLLCCFLESLNEWQNILVCDYTSEPLSDPHSPSCPLRSTILSTFLFPLFNFCLFHLLWCLIHHSMSHLPHFLISCILL